MPIAAMFKNSKQSFVVKSLLVAFAYFIPTKFGMLFTIPPSTAAAIWIPSGIALAAVLMGGYRYLLAIFLGSLSAEISILSFSAFPMALGMAFGATLQAAFGNFLIKKFLPYPDPLYSKRAVIVFLLLATACCVVSATVGNAILLYYGYVPIQQITISWLTWGVGDAIGSLIFAPLILILVEQPASVWRSRVVSVGLPLLILFVSTSVLFLIARSQEQKQIKLHFDFRAAQLAEKISSKLQQATGYRTAQLKQLVTQALKGSDISDISITLRDQSNNTEIQALNQSEKTDKPLFSFQHAYTVGGQQWLLIISPSATYWGNNRPWYAWGVLTGGLGVVILIECLLLILAGKTATIQQIVDEQTVQLRNYVSELKERNEELDQFAYIASHDLKAPIRGISNLSVLIEEDMGDKLSPESKKFLAQLKTRVTRMNNLIAGILEYSRAGRIHAELEKIDTTALLKEIIENLSPPAGFTITVQQNMPILMAARIPLSQVFSNLIGNAIKYHHRKEGPGQITISCKNNPDHYEFVVTDDGPGIAKEFHEKIFGLFQTLQPKDSFESTGLGLTIVKKIIEKQGGKIWVESEIGRGTAFHFIWIKITC